MPSRTLSKAEGLDRLRQFLLSRDTFLPQAEIARHLGVDRSTIGRWLISLEQRDVPIQWDDQARVRIDRAQYFTSLRLSRAESVAAMIALRLFQQYQDQPNALSVSLLQKLGLALHRGVAPAAGNHILALTQKQQLQVTQSVNSAQRIFEAFGEAWLDNVKLQIRYRPLGWKRAFDDVFHIYLLEPSAIGHSTYAIGFSELAQALRIRKLERVERTPLRLDEPCAPPNGFDPTTILSGAWRIWFDADAQPTTITLRFSGREAIQRITETRWHPSQHTELDSEGRLLWRVDIDEPQELLPWVRGWGAACEVLEPALLRDQILGEIQRQMQLYGLVATPETDRGQRFRDLFE